MFGYLPNSFALERKHRWTKRYVDVIRNWRANLAGTERNSDKTLFYTSDPKDEVKLSKLVSKNNNTCFTRRIARNRTKIA